jgi:GNAT superfamily N-acetyltransferase
MELVVRKALPRDLEGVVGILAEAARWLEARGSPMWQTDELSPSQIAADIEAGLVFVGESGDGLSSTVKFQLEDSQFWPDIPPGQSAYLHRLAMRRKYAGTGVSLALLNWAARRTRDLGRPFLRLDCEASRPRLRALYERFGFVHHSDRQVGPYFVSRFEFEVSKLSDSREPPVARNPRGTQENARKAKR